MLQANWIWAQGQARRPYNQTIIARERFTVDGQQSAMLRITADSAYRCNINGVWVSDGPCRAWPEHYQYDKIDIAHYLEAGENEIQIIAKFWGTGTFHQVPREAGLLAQLDITTADGSTQSVSTDESWEAAVCPAWLWNTPKVSIQMEPQEAYDARLAQDLDFAPAAVLYSAHEGPWQDLHPRDVPLLTKEPIAFQTLLGANVVKHREDMVFCLPAARLAYPEGTVEANRNLIQAGGMATVLSVEEQSIINFAAYGMIVYVDGNAVEHETQPLSPGDHLVVAFVSEPVGHNKEKLLCIIDPPASLCLSNPCSQENTNPWCYLAFPEYTYAGDDLRWPAHGLVPELEQQLTAYMKYTEELGAAATDVAAIAADLDDRGKDLAATEMFALDTHWRFFSREVITENYKGIENPVGMLYDNAEVTVVEPCAEGDVELILDLGEQNIGYYDLELTADEGVEVDIYGVEYIAPGGTVQHTIGNRNGLHYITKAGVNTFTSFKRRSGRYVFITLQNQTTPVTIRNIRLIESTYPVNAIGTFRCGDETLTQIWNISARTLKLCMEDTFTDCPLYEQTLWVGDARNESVFAYPVFGAVDIARRCATLAAQSLERYPIVGSQVPSAWDVLLPAWSFLWGISIWDYYTFTGDKAFVETMWPAVVGNLEGAAKLRDEVHGLFKGPFWNMFDWSGIDDNHEIVLHNSMLMVGAIDAAQKCADLLLDEVHATWLAALRKELTDSLNALWNPETKTYPDSVHEDGTISPSTSQHTSFLALLYDIIPETYAADALGNMLEPPEGMVRVGSPFAMMTFYEALEKVGHDADIVQSIIDAYTPMLTSGATTVWEVFPSSDDRPRQFPTRSHCHAWSSAPVYFLNRIILGIRPVATAGEAFEISPLLLGSSWAEGSVATVKGPLHVSYKAGDETLDIRVSAPEDTKVTYRANPTHEGLDVTFTVEEQELA